MNTKFLLAAVLCLAGVANNASAQFQVWNIGPLRNVVGTQIRHASPLAYQVVLGANRSIPPQVKNGGGGFAPGPFSGGGQPYGLSPYQAELAYQRSIPPQVKNEWQRQARLAAMMPPVQPNPPVIAPPDQPPAPAPAVLPPVGPTGAPSLLPNDEIPRIAR